MMSRWLDHLPPWLALFALAGTGTYEPGELVFMALLLAMAMPVEWRRWDLSPWRLPLELGALILFLAGIALFHNVFAAVIHLLCALCGLRLALPRGPRERRQLLLMSFLLFLTTAISTTDIAFLLFSLMWSFGAMALLVQLSWEQSAHLRRGIAPRAPFRRLPLWLGSSALIGSLFFFALPRTTLGIRPLPSLLRRLTGAGLSSNVDLAKEGPIQDNDSVAMRITPIQPKGERSLQLLQQQLALLKGLSLESVQGARWEASSFTPSHGAVPLQSELERADEPEAEFFFIPSQSGLLPLPYGAAWVRQPLPMSLSPAEGGGLRWAFPPASGLSLRMGWRTRDAVLTERHGFLTDRRRALLTAMGPEHESMRRASFAWAPDRLAPQALATKLQEVLQQTCSYTLDNPSGGASNPLTHFLEVSRAGHCEYFASALALMLRARGVPARIAAGYRLGPWNPDGGYFIVTQNQAHAWVEYWDDSVSQWRLADPTPSGPLASADASTLNGWSRALDAVRYRWDRFVVRFSGKDQMAGLSWTQARLNAIQPAQVRAWAATVFALLLGAIAWRTRNRWRTWLPAPAPSGAIAALRPLLRRARRDAPPANGETVRAWLTRLASLQPDLADRFHDLAQQVDRHAYGEQSGDSIRQGVRDLLKAWRRRR